MNKIIVFLMLASFGLNAGDGSSDINPTPGSASAARSSRPPSPTVSDIGDDNAQPFRGAWDEAAHARVRAAIAGHGGLPILGQVLPQTNHNVAGPGDQK